MPSNKKPNHITVIKDLNVGRKEPVWSIERNGVPVAGGMKNRGAVASKLRTMKYDSLVEIETERFKKFAG